MWNFLNMGKSLELEEKLMYKRFQHVWQIALGVVLYRVQVSQGNHFHWEQPGGSDMFKFPELEEVQQCCYLCRFDLCRVGNLQDPRSHAPIRKRLQVLSTSEDMYHEIHGKFCHQDHEHQHVAGSRVWQGKSMPMSRFTQHYPPKFAKTLAKIMLHEVSKPHVILANEDEDQHPTKKRRLGQKLSPQQIAERFQSPSWQTVMQEADKVAPRVGIKVLEHVALIDLVKRMCPLHYVQHVVLCRGTDRCVGPNKALQAFDAPLRRRICIRRRLETIEVEDDWESWSRLSLKALRRKAVPARVSLTVFARAKVPEVPNDTAPPASQSQNEPTPLTHEVPEMSDESPPKRACRESAKETPDSPEGQQIPPSEQRHVVDLANEKHGPAFLKLGKETQSWILKLHRNLGHPSAAKLVEFCKQLGCPTEIQNGIRELKCSTCQEQQTPQIARPAAIHAPGDFGDVISMDAVKWTNQQGEQFVFYHFVDQSTSYQTAVAVPSTSAGSAIHALLHGWISWAGPPGLLCVDAATELNSEEFSKFLHKHGIPAKTIAPEAHWQNARAERHGGILQQILNKMDVEEPISSMEQLANALAFATHTKNQWSRHRGYPPELLVFGKSRRVVGSVISDSSMASHTAALEESPDGIRFREELALRERARKAFASVDNHQVLRRAMVHRSRPSRGNYSKGEWVMVWKKRGEADGQWHGPLQVVIQESPHVIWVTGSGKLYRVAPEHVRPLSAMEETTHQQTLASGQSPESILPSIIPSHGGVQYHNLINNSTPNNQRNPTSNNAHNNMINQLPDVQVPEESPATEINQTDSPHGHSNGSEQPDDEPEIQPPAESSTPDVEPNHVEIPVPDDSDTDLVCEECWHLEQDQAWCFEVNICQQDINKWRRETSPHEMAFLVSAAKRQRSEVKLANLTPEQQKQFAEAKANEIDSWLATETVAKVLRHQIPAENILRCRWILTWKDVEPSVSSSEQRTEKPLQKAKARLVVLGYEDPQVDSIPRDSPTMSKLSRMLILQMAASRRWTIGSFDIKTAFLRGQEQGSRILGLEPPIEMRQRLKMQPVEALQLLKGAYGRVDAPYLWFQELKTALESLQFKAAPFDPCTFVLVDDQGVTQGIVGVHVDDGLCCGSALFHGKLQELQEISFWQSETERIYIYQPSTSNNKDDFSITVDQQQYIKDIQPIALSRARRLQQEDVVNEKERQSLRGLIGSLLYGAVNSRPDLCARLGWLQSQVNKAKVATLLEANRILHEAKEHSSVSLRIQPISVDDLRFVAFSDASFALEKVQDSHQGMIVMAAHRNIGHNQRSPINPICWHSKKIQRVTVSTLSAEAMALAGAVDCLSWVRVYWAWLVDANCDWRRADSLLQKLPPAFSAIHQDEDTDSSETFPLECQALLEQTSVKGILTTDCKSLFDLISRTVPPACQEFRTQLQAKLIKEHLQNGIQIRWVPSGAQIADALTKIMDCSMLRACLKSGWYPEHRILIRIKILIWWGSKINLRY